MSTNVPIAYLVACSASKRDTACPAAELYTGALFRAARRLVEQRQAPWAILSAKHGLLKPDQVVEPYDQRVPSTGLARWDWAELVAVQLMRYPTGTRFVVLASHAYRVAFDVYKPDLEQWFTWETPLAGLGIGRQKQWLAQQLAPEAA